MIGHILTLRSVRQTTDSATRGARIVLLQHTVVASCDEEVTIGRVRLDSVHGVVVVKPRGQGRDGRAANGARLEVVHVDARVDAG